MKHPEKNRATYTDVSGIILSGGKSMRMGCDKALLRTGSETIIERILRLMNPLFENVFIITNTPAEYNFLGIQLYEDIYKHKGPLSGIHSGLIHSKTEKIFFISCDLPLMSEEMIKYIVEFESKKPAKYCSVSNYHHYLAGIYPKSLLPEIEKVFLLYKKSSTKKEQFYSVKYLIDKVGAEVINPVGLSFYNDDLFFNLNSPEDFEYIKEKFLC